MISARAIGVLHYLVMRKETLNAQELSDYYTEGRDAMQRFLRELIAVGFIDSKKVRIGSRYVRTQKVTPEGRAFIGVSETDFQGLKSPRLYLQNSQLDQIGNSSKVFYESTKIREGEIKVGYEFYEKTESESEDIREARAKDQAWKQNKHDTEKAELSQKRFTERRTRAPKDWTPTDIGFEFANRVHDLWHIPQWQVGQSRFIPAIGGNRKTFGTKGDIELEMLNIFFGANDFKKYDSADSIWKSFIAQYAGLATQAKLRLSSHDDLANAQVQAEEESWKGF